MLASETADPAQLLPATSQLPHPAVAWDWLAQAPFGLASRTHPQEMEGQSRRGEWSGHTFPTHSQYKSAPAVFKLWLYNLDVFTLFTFQAGWLAFGVQKGGP